MENKISENYLKIDDIYKKLNESTKDNYDKFSFKGLITFVKVVYIIDGDTCDVVFPVNLGNNINFIKTRVRLLGYDAPEIKTKNSQQKELGLIAKKALSELVIDNNHIIMDIKGIDAFGRSLVVLYHLENLEIYKDLQEKLLNYKCENLWDEKCNTSLTNKFNDFSNFISLNFNCFTNINKKMIELGHVK